MANTKRGRYPQKEIEAPTDDSDGERLKGAIIARDWKKEAVEKRDSFSALLQKNMRTPRAASQQNNPPPSTPSTIFFYHLIRKSAAGKLLLL